MTHHPIDPDRCQMSIVSPMFNTLFTPAWTLLPQKLKIYQLNTLTIPSSANAGAQYKEYSDSGLTFVSWNMDFKILEVGSSVIRYLNFFSLTPDEVPFTMLILIESCKYYTQDNHARDFKLHWNLGLGIFHPN